MEIVNQASYFHKSCDTQSLSFKVNICSKTAKSFKVKPLYSAVPYITFELEGIKTFLSKYNVLQNRDFWSWMRLQRSFSVRCILHRWQSTWCDLPVMLSRMIWNILRNYVAMMVVGGASYRCRFWYCCRWCSRILNLFIQIFQIFYWRDVISLSKRFAFIYTEYSIVIQSVLWKLSKIFSSRMPIAICIYVMRIFFFFKFLWVTVRK